MNKLSDLLILLLLIPSLSWGLTLKDGKQVEVEENTSPNSISCPITNISNYEESTSHDHSDIKIKERKSNYSF